MKIATIRTGQETRAARLDADVYTEIDGIPDVGALLQQPQWQTVAAQANGPRHQENSVDLGPVVPRPSKIICVGANYATHIEEMGSQTPSHPTLFAKFPEALVGPFDDIELPAEDPNVDWEAELAVVIGTPARRVPEDEALDHVAGYAIMNDISMRGYQFRTAQWLQGKTWERSSPFGPWLVTPDEHNPDATIRTVLNGEVVQEDSIRSTVFDTAYLISYISAIVTLNPGDVVITGTPAGVGAARDPQRYLRPNDLLETSIEGLGNQRNRAVATAQLAGNAASARSL